MTEQRKLPLDDDKTRLKLSIKSEQDETPKSTASFATEDEQYTPDDEPMSVGAHLRLERERQELSLHEVAERLRLRAKQLQALEEGDYDSLPGQTFVIGFIRSYATSLGLDAIAVVDLYKSETGAGSKAPDLAFPEPTSEGRMPRVSLMAISALVALLLFAGWYFYLEENTLELEIVQELPERLLEKITGEESEATRSDDLNTQTSADLNEVADTVPAPTLKTVTPSEENAVEPVPDDVSESSVVNTSEAQDTSANISAENTASNEGEVSAPSSDTPEANAKTPDENGAGIVSMTPQVEPSTEVSSVMSESVGEQKLPNTTAIESQSQSEDVTDETVIETPVMEERVPEEPQTTEEAPSSNNFQQLTLSNNAETDSIETTAGRDEPVALGVENAQARLVLVANQESWVQIKSTDGETVLDRIMTTGDTFMLPNRADLTLNTANASGLELRLDGAVLGSLGSYGQIVRALPLKPEELKAKFSAQN